MQAKTSHTYARARACTSNMWVCVVKGSGGRGGRKKILAKKAGNFWSFLFGHELFLSIA